jgi:hypothetical protein
MKDNNKKFSESFLFSGKKLKLADGIYVNHPIIEDILNYSNDEHGFDNYCNGINVLVCDPYDYMVMLDDMGIDYEDADNFDVFCILWNKCFENYEKNKELFDLLNAHPIDYVKKALTFFLGKHNFNMSSMLFQSNGKTVKDKILVDADLIHKDKHGKDVCDYVITRYMFNNMSEFISEINGIDKSEQIHPQNQSYKKMLIEDMRDELKKTKKKHNDMDYSNYMGKVMEAVCGCGNGGITVFNINQVHIYQLLIGFSKFIKKNNVDHLMNGQYDLSKISKKELDWFG